MKSSNSEGVDGINVNVIKASIDLLASPLSQMCNISFSTGIVPQHLRVYLKMRNHDCNKI